MVAHNIVSSEMSSLLLIFFSVFLYVATTEHRYMLFPHLFFFFCFYWKENRTHSVPYFAFSLPVSLRFVHFCTERASSFLLQCVPVCGWARLYLSSPQNDRPLGCFQAFAIANSLGGQPGPALCCTRQGCPSNLQSGSWVVPNCPCRDLWVHA